MKLTALIKLLPTPDQADSLLETMKAANEACDRISAIAVENQAFTQLKVHRLAYHSLRASTNLSSEMIMKCIAKVVDSGKSANRFNFKPHGAIAYDPRIISYSGTTASIWTINGRLRIPFVCHNERFLPYIKGPADLVYSNGKFYVFQVIEVDEESIEDIEEFIGIDFDKGGLCLTPGL